MTSSLSLSAVGEGDLRTRSKCAVPGRVKECIRADSDRGHSLPGYWKGRKQSSSLNLICHSFTSFPFHSSFSSHIGNACDTYPKTGDQCFSSASTGSDGF